MTLQANIKHQYIELLIRLIQTNSDHTWLPYFLRLRTGGRLPRGGAGSLNDWGPSYVGLETQVWFSKIYEATKFLFEQDLNPYQIGSLHSIKLRNIIRIIRCLNCYKSYQHPSIFEGHFALDFLKNNYAVFAETDRLIEVLNPDKTFNNNEVIEYRSWLTDQYSNNNIVVYDFVSANYVCPHCDNKDADFEYDLYKIDETVINDRIFKLVKQNASWHDFEQ